MRKPSKPSVQKRAKSPAQIEKERLKKELELIEERMEGRSDLWLDFFEGFMSALITDERSMMECEERIKNAGLLADNALAVYESRWGEIFSR